MTNEATYREFSPSLLLSEYVECYWVGTAVASSVNTVSRVLPDGCVDLIFNLGDPFLCRASASCLENRFKQYVVGAMTRPIVVEAIGNMHLLGIRFKPGGAAPFFRFPLDAITDCSVDLADVWEGFNEGLAEQLSGLSKVCHRIAYLETFLLRHLPATTARRDGIQEAVRIIKQHNGQVSLGKLGSRFGVCLRQIERKFRAQTGLTPKRYCRIVRLQHAVSLLKARRNVDLSDVVFEAGYYDQSHFTKEFKELSGTTPKAFVQGH